MKKHKEGLFMLSDLLFMCPSLLSFFGGRLEEGRGGKKIVSRRQMLHKMPFAFWARRRLTAAFFAICSLTTRLRGP